MDIHKLILWLALAFQVFVIYAERKQRDFYREVIGEMHSELQKCEEESKR